MISELAVGGFNSGDGKAKALRRLKPAVRKKYNLVY
jgi:hypothetical protein